MLRLAAISLLLIAAAGCAQVQRLARLIHDSEAALAAQVMITRDEWGTPHIRGETDASTVFGHAYAQAEDDFHGLETMYIRALGRAAEVGGEADLTADLVRAALRVQELSREEYDREPDERRALWDAWAAGINYWLRMHPEERPRLLHRFEPWYVFAAAREIAAGTVLDGMFEGGADPIAGPATPAPRLARMPFVPDTETSTAWAIAPARTRGGRALLLSAAHGRFFDARGSGACPPTDPACSAPATGSVDTLLPDPRLPREVHLDSDEGWHVAGAAIPGSPVPHSGRNEGLAWAETRGGAIVDVWRVTFDHPTDPVAYRHGEEWRTATEWQAEVRVLVDSTTEARTFRFRATHHGPIFPLSDGGYAAIGIARHDEGGSLQQRYAMGKAGTLDEFMSALAQTSLPGSGVMAADAAGTLLHVHGSAVPRRADAHDRTTIMDGADPGTGWQGYHTLEELPQLLNPAAGWLQSTGGTFASGESIGAASYPSYMMAPSDHPRAARARDLLATRADWDLEALEAAAFDTGFPGANRRIAAWILAWERIGGDEPERAMALDRPIDLLRTWDGVGTTASSATTLYVLALDAERADTTDGALGALERAAAALRAARDTVEVAWGDVNRLRPPAADASRADSSGLAVPGAPAWTGALFDIDARPSADGDRRADGSGYAWVSVTELGPTIRARSVLVFGQSRDPQSPHAFDQAPLYTAGTLRAARFSRAEVDASAVRQYRPGEEAGGR